MLTRAPVSLACAALLAACAQPSTRPADSQDTAPPLRADITEAGLAAYQRVCAQCHETGRMGAPLTGQPEYWAGRSRLWQAVLFRHAEQGYVKMPARGGDESLTDREVQAAAEYMLAVTGH
jgi:cytochrome c5